MKKEMQRKAIIIKYIQTQKTLTTSSVLACLLVLTLLTPKNGFGQLFVARDTIMVIESGYVLKMPWANGLNYSSISNIDLNLDGKKDIVAFDRINQFGIGKMRCFINNGAPGDVKYIASPALTYSFPLIANWAICKDYDCDGKEDLFCSTNGGIMVYRNTSTLSSGLSFQMIKPLIYSNFKPGISNLYAAPNGVPAIDDIDNDGDLDILTFSPQGVFIEYHKNMSIENYGTCDSLIYELETGCWGKIIESSCVVNFNQTCAFRPLSDSNKVQNSALHAGSCLTSLDSDGDGDKDLLIGDISCDIVQYVHNSGTVNNAIITDTTKLYPNYPSKNNTTQIKMNIFPGAYYVDVDGDTKKDLVVTPSVFGSGNVNSVWYYKNSSTTNTVNFQFIKKNLFQDEMIEAGANSSPILFDYNSDGKKDLLIGTFGYNNMSGQQSQLCLYENKGTLAQPVFSLVTRDYANLSAQGLNFAIPTVGDIDGDNDIDILVGTSNGKVHWLKNTAGAGNICNFSIFLNDPFGFTTNSAVAELQLFDIDTDGKLDLMIGAKNGRIAYYKNVGTTTSPSFTLITNFFGGIDVKGLSSLYGIDGYAYPHFYKEGSNTFALVGSISGQIFHYSVPADISTPCTLINSNINGINEGAQSTVCFEDINNDNKRDLFVGNAGGGLSFFSSKGPEVSVKENSFSNAIAFAIFPNPSSGNIKIEIDQINAAPKEILIYNILGKVVYHQIIKLNINNIDVSFLGDGVYEIIVRETASGIRGGKKFILSGAYTN
ncbi:MAG: T9SS type A sorting domain-containing protein [Bacteroidetes bacterium]|nr:T9SS type A sorting domain-containing protein [Bacteroidota bacterium]